LEELLGVRTDRRGKRGGRPPKVVPMARIHEINRRLFQDDLLEMAANVGDIRTYLLQVAKGEVAPDRDRIAVCQWIYERLLGKQPIQLEVSTRQPSEYERAGVTQAVTIRTGIDTDADDEPIDVDSIEVDPWEIDDNADPFGPEPEPPKTMNPTWDD
jgi:hypothetical protein